MITKIDRLETGIKDLDSYVNYLCTAIELATNVTVSPPLQMRRTPGGLQLAWSMKTWQWAKSSSSGIPAMSGSTPGSATDVVLYDFNGTTLSTQAVTDKVYNMGATAVGASKWLLITKVEKYWFVVWEQC